MNGLVSEGSGENLFVVYKGQLLTSDLGSSVLAGITRASILTLARDFGIPVVEQPIPRELLYIADEVFFTGTAAEVTPIRSIDRITIKDGLAGPDHQAVGGGIFWHRVRPASGSIQLADAGQSCRR